LRKPELKLSFANTLNRRVPRDRGHGVGVYSKILRPVLDRFCETTLKDGRLQIPMRTAHSVFTGPYVTSLQMGSADVPPLQTIGDDFLIRAEHSMRHSLTGRSLRMSCTGARLQLE